PPLLAAALHQAGQVNGLRGQVSESGAALQDCRRQVDRLVGLLWRTLPTGVLAGWLTQRHMLGRLPEELNRAQRHGTPLPLGPGEIHPASGDRAEASETLASWTTDQITRGKRRCDVAGEYGLHGFMLLMVHTPKQGGVSCCRRLQALLEQPAHPSQGR